MPKPILKRMWQDIIKQKIENQALALKYLGMDEGYKELIKMKEFVLSGEVDSVEWVKFEDALGKLREGSIAWQLVKKVIEEVNL